LHSTPAVKKLRINRSNRRSDTRVATAAISRSWFTRSKDGATDCPSPPYSAEGDNRSKGSRFRRSGFTGNWQSFSAWCFVRSGQLTGREPFAYSGKMD
jgi:hypothetical protein